MSISFYMNENVPRMITIQLRLKGVDIITVQEDGQFGISDEELLSRASQLKRVLFTFDDDLLKEALQRQKKKYSI